MKRSNVFYLTTACRRASSLFGKRFEQSEAIERLERFESLFYDVIDTFFRRRYFFRKRLRVFQISDSELGVRKRGIVDAVATVFS